MIKNNLHKIIIFSAISVFLMLGAASAESRYGTPPPIILSPDLTASWVLPVHASPALQRQQARNNRARGYQVPLAKSARRSRSTIQTKNSRKTHRRTVPAFGQSGLRLQARARVNILDAQMNHETCKGGWATPPDRLDSSRITAGHPFYMEMRLRQTPHLPVGHTYIAYGRLSPSGQPVEERLIMLSPVGGYSGAAIAAVLPMPGILKPVFDDCKLKPVAAYRISLTARQYEQLLRRIQQAQANIPAYALFAYNCNHFASDIAAAVGILPPKNKYLPALKYIYGVIKANEGYSPRGKLPS
ncbi:MAG: hypothetical protein GY761_09155 [Hyphomicrobiales bacterium]|nr:hypothetical protein [Hyphomicrobiales bacterium]